MGGSSSQTVNVGSRSVSRRQQSSVERIPNDNVGDSKEQPLRRRPRIVPFSDQLDEVVINSGRAKFFEDDPQKSTIKNLQEISDQSAIFLLDLAMKHLGVDDVWIKANFSKVVLPSLKQIFLPEDEVLFAEGDRGTYLYIIEQGAISVIQDEVEVDVLTNGAILGLESLKFGFPRSFTARSLERCRLWSLNRKNYAALVQEISSPKLSVNARRFLEVPEVAALPSVYIEKLMQNLSSSTYENNQDIFTAGRCCSKVMVIESGHVDVHFPENMLDLSEDEFIHKLGIHVDLAGIFTPTGSPLSWGYVLGRGDSIPAAPAGSPGANRSSSVVPPSRSGSGSGPVADVTPRATKSCATTPVMGTGRKKFHEPSTISAAAIQELEAQPKSDATDALTPISRAAPRKSSVTAIASKMGLYDEVRESRTQPGATGTKSETGDSGSAVAAAQSQSAASSISLPLSNLMRSPMGSVSAHNLSLIHI